MKEHFDCTRTSAHQQSVWRNRMEDLLKALIGFFGRNFGHPVPLFIIHSLVCAKRTRQQLVMLA